MVFILLEAFLNFSRAYNINKIISVSLLSLISFAGFAESYDHSGIYLGVSGQNNRSENEIKTANPSTDPAYRCGHYAFGCGENININNSSTSALIGFQEQFANNIVLGIEGKYDFTSFDKSNISSQSNSAEGDYGSVKIKDMGSISAKFGYAIQNSNTLLNNSLIYGKVGYASLKSNTELWDLGKIHTMYGDTVKHHGYLVGLGIEKPLDFISDSLKNTLIGIEYSHLNLNTKNNNAIDSTPIEGPGVLTNPSINSLAIKLQYKFNIF